MILGIVMLNKKKQNKIVVVVSVLNICLMIYNIVNGLKDYLMFLEYYIKYDTEYLSSMFMNMLPSMRVIVFFVIYMIIFIKFKKNVNGNPEYRLIELNEMYEQGKISEQEYIARKIEILEEM